MQTRDIDSYREGIHEPDVPGVWDRLGCAPGEAGRPSLSTAKGLYGPRELTEREKELARMVSEGMRNKDIAEVVGTSEHVIKNRLRRIFDKTGMDTRLELALWYLLHKGV